MTSFSERSDHWVEPRRPGIVPRRRKSLHFLARQQSRIATYSKAGRSEHELFRGRSSTIKLTVLALRAGLQVGVGDELCVRGVVVQVLSGVVRYGGCRPVLIACPGDLIMLVGEVNSLRAETDIVVLVTSPTTVMTAGQDE